MLVGTVSDARQRAGTQGCNVCYVQCDTSAIWTLLYHCIVYTVLCTLHNTLSMEAEGGGKVAREPILETDEKRKKSISKVPEMG